jgi:hypothetical protein
MTIHQLKPSTTPHANHGHPPSNTGNADEVMAGLILQNALGLNFIACYLLWTGRKDEAKALERIAEQAKAISRDIQPPCPPGNANETADGR